MARRDPAREAATARIDGWVRKWAGHLLLVARGYCRNEADAQDAVAECWTVALAKWDRLPDEERARGWLIGITVNVARARMRTRRRRSTLESEQSHDVAPVRETRQPPVEVRLLVEAAMELISDLPELQRTVVMHRVIDGLSTKETAQVTGKAEGTVKTSLFRGLKRLREELGADLETALASIGTRNRKPQS